MNLEKAYQRWQVTTLTPGPLVFIRPNVNQISYLWLTALFWEPCFAPMENSTSPMRVERAMLEYLQYMPLVTLFRYPFERLKCELSILSEKTKSPSLATDFILPWHTSQKPHIQDQAFYLPDGTIKDHRGADNSPVGQQ